MGLSNVQLLLLANFFHYLAQGVIIPGSSPHLKSQGASQITLGCLATGVYIGQTLGRDFLSLFEFGKKQIINFSLYCTFFMFFTLVFYNSFLVAGIIKCLHSLCCLKMNLLSKEFVAKTQPEDEHTEIFNLLDISRVLGLSLGSVSGGYTYAFNEDFTDNCMVATVCSLISILILQYIDQDEEVQRPKLNLVNVPQIWQSRIQSLRDFDNYKTHWDSILLKTAYVGSFAIYFARYCFILNFNYKAGTVLTGYATAYQIIWLFASSCLVPFVKARFPNKISLFEHSVLICAFALVGIHYAPTYECFLMLFVPMAFTYTIVNSFFDEDILELRKKGVYEIADTISCLLNIMNPIFFGILWYVLEAHAFKVISLLPMVAWTCIIHRRFVRRGEREEEERRQETVDRVKED